MYKSLPTFRAEIFLGLRESYYHPNSNLRSIIHSIKEVEDICQSFINDIKWAVTVTPTKFIYVDGQEEGCIVGIIQYPRFPLSETEILSRTFKLAKLLKEKMNQERCSVVCTDKSYLIE